MAGCLHPDTRAVKGSDMMERIRAACLYRSLGVRACEDPVAALVVGLSGEIREYAVEHQIGAVKIKEV